LGWGNCIFSSLEDRDRSSRIAYLEENGKLVDDSPTVVMEDIHLNPLDYDLHPQVEQRWSGRAHSCGAVVNRALDVIMQSGVCGTRRLANTSRIGINCRIGDYRIVRNSKSRQASYRVGLCGKNLLA
jgi:hypothetical protein